MSRPHRVYSLARSNPVVGVVCDRMMVDDAPYLACEERYVAAIREGAGATPFLIPSLKERSLGVDEVLGVVAGLIFTGSPSNVLPARYDSTSVSRTPGKHDPARDAVALPLLQAALQRGVPLLATCRGMQEMNVVCGGTLHQKVQDTDGYMDHREGADLNYEKLYEPAHGLQLMPGGFFSRLCGKGRRLVVNSLHEQGIDRLGRGLVVEAVAPDGLVEAIRYVDHPFAIGTQFHPEWAFDERSLSVGLFASFGRALRGTLDLRKSAPQAQRQTA